MLTHTPRVFIAALFFAVSVFTANAQAAACKSLEHKACTEDASCSWVSSYQRSDGRSVRAHCRKAPGKKDVLSSASSAAQKASD